MSGTTVATGSLLSPARASSALTVQILRAPGNLSMMTGPVDQNEAKVGRIQSDPGMPFIRITDLSKGVKGDEVTCDSWDTPTAVPFMDGENVEGRGVPMSSSSFKCKINFSRHVVDAGGVMDQQRSAYELQKLARGFAAAYFPRHLWVRCMTHVMGMRGSQDGVSWSGLPLATHSKFNQVMINPVLAPTRNRHYVLDDTNGLVQGGELVNSLATADVWKLSRLDELCSILESLETKVPPPVMIGDEQGVGDPLLGILLMPPSSYNKLITDITSGNNLRAFQAAVEQRQKYAPQSAVFRGKVGIWRKLLVKMIDHTWYRDAGQSVNYVTSANQLTETESSITVAAIGAGFQMERCVVLGAQTLARAEGATHSGEQAEIRENTYDAGYKTEYIAGFMGGERKFRHYYTNPDGNKQPTDNVMVIDAVAPKIVSS